ncbi:hypothetical protein L1987_13745 [Smallanthus sonchifolius]|uniref:Uncharacterized protein n=1 Tax=Smallanthus sonchifolius TaxID=185202 RepID=A0ACB9JHS8_9ASTR|nr:hypothetical protein L1987_13745 [Smallanthus sonchifolius]
MTDNIPKDVKVYEKLEQILELGMKEDGKVERILELVQQLVSNQNNLQILDEYYDAAYGTPGPSVEVLSNAEVGVLKKELENG